MVISGMTGGEGTMNKKAILLRGKVKNVDEELLDKVFEVNTYMCDIYTEKESRMVLEVFQYI